MSRRRPLLAAALAMTLTAIAHADERPAATLLTATGGSGGGWYASSPFGVNFIDPAHLPDARYGLTLAALGPRGLAWTAGADLGRYSRTTTRQLGPESYQVALRAHSYTLWSGVAQYWSPGDGVWVFAGPQLGVWSGRYTTKNGLADTLHHPRAVWFNLGARVGVMAPLGRHVWASASASHLTGVVHASQNPYDSVWWAGDTRMDLGLVLDVSARH